MGDVEAASEVTVNTKGGSMTATLKKGLRERLGQVFGRLAGGVLQFETGQSLLLLSPGAGAGLASVRVQRIGRNRFEIELDTHENEEVDEVTAAFLRLKQAQFVNDELTLLPPVDADELRAEADRDMAEARAAMARLQAEPEAAVD